MENKIGILHDTLQGMSADAEDKGKDTFGITLTHEEAKTICWGLIALGNENKAVETEVKYNSPYERTVEGMLSPHYKERFKAEYQQTRIRYEKLKAFCNRIEAARRTQCDPFIESVKKVDMPGHDCPYELLREQQSLMGQYLHILEVRAVIEGIEL